MITVETIPSQQLSDEEIVDRIRSGEKALYELIMRRYNLRLFRVGISILKDENQTEELMQETYVKAYEKLHQFQQRSSFGTWLTRIMINECLMWRRRNERFSSGDEWTQENEPDPSSAYDLKTPEYITMNNELKSILEKAILDLPEKYRLVYTMREVEKMNVEESAMLLNISPANVKVRLNRAKAMMREQITKRYEETEVFSFHLSRCDRIVESVMRRI